MPGRHPDDDLLADLAADVLPLDRARAVETHVLGCDRCATLLSEAERLRALLLADDPGPVPMTIWDRIEAALAAEVSERNAPERPGPGAPTPAGRPADADGWDLPGPLDDPATWGSSGDVGPDGREASRNGTRSADPSDPVTPVTESLRRSTASRRDTRGGRREARRRLLSPALLAAAAVVALVAVVGTVRLTQSGGGATDATAGPASGDAASANGAGADGAAARPVPAAAGATSLLASGTRYTTAAFRAQVHALVPVRSAGKDGATGGSAGEAGPAGRPGPTAPAPSPAPAQGRSAPPGTQPSSIAPDPRATDLRNPQRLAACLTTLDAGQERLVVVDFATFDGREAAVLVLQATDGGYEVFVVERTCAPGHEGALDYATLPS
ncbi:MAG TPA: hypothetical protein VMT69_10195 [Kineosporiaceae bacterium]|nr:hypothetical protein [Kineosporiaceae bacterium]